MRLISKQLEQTFIDYEVCFNKPLAISTTESPKNFIEPKRESENSYLTRAKCDEPPVSKVHAGTRLGILAQDARHQVCRFCISSFDSMG